MLGLDGLQTLRRIMAECPRPVLTVSSVTVKDAEATFDALAAGAFDYVPKQLSAESLDIFHIRDDLIGKIKAGADSHRGSNHLGGRKKILAPRIFLCGKDCFVHRLWLPLADFAGHPLPQSQRELSGFKSEV